MNKILNMMIMLSLLAYPVYSQNNDIEEEVPLGKLILKGKDIPVSLKKAAEKNYSNGNVFQYYSFPYLLKEYGWAFKNNESDMPDNSEPTLYAVQIQTDQGTIDAVYTGDGKLIRSREVLKDIELPTSVMNAYEKSEYHNCRIVQDKLKIINGKNNKMYYTIFVEKDGRKHAMYFDKDGNRLRNVS